MINRSNQRAENALRTIEIQRDYLHHAAGSCLIKAGGTEILCAASIEEHVPGWLVGKKKGWVTAEYSLLPASTHSRNRRERKGAKGRTLEIERLIARALRTVVDLEALGEITITLDCDVIQADGSTRCMAITGAYIALVDALAQWREAGKIQGDPLLGQVAAISVGMVDGLVLTDLDYNEDSRAEVDMNVIGDDKGRFIEIQGTGEQLAFSRPQLNTMLDAAQAGLAELLALQKEALATN
ncbi:MAG: ribonuclease PH [Coriobacteriia bacterium]|nr:ribonuclease PH [Coriobacteriia bacterium]MCL2537462.1 ribonuclease PH [Coriobacteriia bacterium]